MDVITQDMGATATAVASSTELASSTVPIKEVSPWFSYTIDIILIVAFLFVWFFVKPEQPNEEELSEEEKPNPLEQILKTDPVEEEKTEDKKEE